MFLERAWWHFDTSDLLDTRSWNGHCNAIQVIRLNLLRVQAVINSGCWVVLILSCMFAEQLYHHHSSIIFLFRTRVKFTYWLSWVDLPLCNWSVYDISYKGTQSITVPRMLMRHNQLISPIWEKYLESTLSIETQSWSKYDMVAFNNLTFFTGFSMKTSWTALIVSLTISESIS